MYGIQDGCGFLVELPTAVADIGTLQTKSLAVIGVYILVHHIPDLGRKLEAERN